MKMFGGPVRIPRAPLWLSTGLLVWYERTTCRPSVVYLSVTYVGLSRAPVVSDADGILGYGLGKFV